MTFCVLAFRSPIISNGSGLRECDFSNQMLLLSGSPRGLLMYVSSYLERFRFLEHFVTVVLS